MSTTRKLKRSMIHYADKKGYIRKWISAKRFNILYVLSIGILLAFMALFVFGCATLYAQYYEVKREQIQISTKDTVAVYTPDETDTTNMAIVYCVNEKGDTFQLSVTCKYENNVMLYRITEIAHRATHCNKAKK